MVFNCLEWEKDTESEKLHPTQKPIKVLQKLIKLFTDPGEVVIDPVAGSASTIIAAIRTGRSAYGFEIKKDFFRLASERIAAEQHNLFHVARPYKEWQQTTFQEQP
jgi:site-specific DNA-methyltransferase (adenine-specific)